MCGNVILMRSRKKKNAPVIQKKIYDCYKHMERLAKNVPECTTDDEECDAFVCKKDEAECGEGDFPKKRQRSMK